MTATPRLVDSRILVTGGTGFLRTSKIAPRHLTLVGSSYNLVAHPHSMTHPHSSSASRS